MAPQAPSWAEQTRSGRRRRARQPDSARQRPVRRCRCGANVRDRSSSSPPLRVCVRRFGRLTARTHQATTSIEPGSLTAWASGRRSGTRSTQHSISIRTPSSPGRMRIRTSCGATPRRTRTRPKRLARISLLVPGRAATAAECVRAGLLVRTGASPREVVTDACVRSASAGRPGRVRPWPLTG